MKNIIRNISLISLLLALCAAPIMASNGNGNGGGTDNGGACWGQATKVFAKTGAMGYHASNQDNPRLGLRNLARVLFEAGLIEDDTMQALGAFVSEDISACE